MEREIYPIELIKTGIYVLRFMNQKKVVYRLHEPVRSLVVYLIEKQGDHWMPLNRDYKPLGLHGYDKWAKYEDYPFLLIPEDKINFKELECECSSQKNLNGSQAFFFFDDCTFPDDAKNKRRYTDVIQKVFFQGNKVIEDEW